MSKAPRSRMDRWKGRTALVTGAGSGIGAAITLELLSHGLKVIGCDKDTQLLYSEKKFSQFILQKEQVFSSHNGLDKSTSQSTACSVVNTEGSNVGSGVSSGHSAGESTSADPFGYRERSAVGSPSANECNGYSTGSGNSAVDSTRANKSSGKGAGLSTAVSTSAGNTPSGFCKGLGATKESKFHDRGVLYPYTCDLRDEDHILAMFEFIQEVLGGVDVCVNVAGISHNAPLLTGKTSEWRDMMDVNVIAYCVCTREAVNQMRQNEVDDGQIIMINSTCGYKVINAKQHHFYTATKHAITALIEGVKNELQEMKSKIRISSISPNIVKTNFLYTMHKPHGTTHIADAIYNSVDYMEPKDVADACVFILSTPPHVQVHDILMQPV